MSTEGAKAAAAAQRDVKTIPGFYVRNAKTLIVVRGPFATEAEADRCARGEVDANWTVVERL